MEEEFKVVRKKKNDDLNKLIIKAKEDSSAQFQLGVKYYNGDGVEQSYEEAVKWFTKSAENGHSQAQYNLAVMYEDGEGVKQNIDEAVKWYKESAKNGNNDSIEALKELGIDYKKEPTTPEEQFQFANDCYKEKKYEEAIKYFEKSAEQGNSKAQYNLGVMYENGEGVEENIDEAKKWYKKSADNGDEDAKDSLKELEDYYKKEKEFTEFNDISELKYFDSLEVIKKIYKITKDYNNLSDYSDVEELNSEIKKKEEKAKEIKRGGCLFVIRIILELLGVSIATFAFISKAWLFGIISCIVFFGISDLIRKGLDNKSDEYIDEKINPIKQRLYKINRDKQQFLQREDSQWAIKMVGEDIFVNKSAVNSLYNLLKDKKANNLQEAIDIYRKSI